MNELVLAFLTFGMLAVVTAAFVAVARATHPEVAAARARHRSDELLVRRACADLDGEYRRLTSRS